LKNFIYFILFIFSSRVEAHEHRKHNYNTSTKTKKKNRNKLLRQLLKTGDLENKSDDKTALTSELSLICNERHSEKVCFLIFLQ